LYIYRGTARSFWKIWWDREH